MGNHATAAPTVDTSHWAYLQGRTAGLKGARTERGLMAFGLGCAGDRQTEINTRLWLKGFDAGEVEAKDLADAAKTAEPVDSWNDYGDYRPRSPGHQQQYS